MKYKKEFMLDNPTLEILEKLSNILDKSESDIIEMSIKTLNKVIIICGTNNITKNQ